MSPLKAALDYLERGWAVIPVQRGAKRPLVAWEPYQHRLPTSAEVEAWFAEWPEANIGLVTGAVSGLVVLDIDPAHDGEESLRRLQRRYGPLPETAIVRTGGGGLHFYFRHPGGEVRNRAGLAPGIDVRGDGGLIVAPPSLHPSGGRYLWEPAHEPEDTGLAPMPDWLLGLARGAGGRPGHTIDYWRRLIREGVPEGQRNSTLASITGHLLWHGVDIEVVTDLLLCWNRERCRPPLSDEEVVRTVESIERTHLRHGPDGAGRSKAD